MLFQVITENGQKKIEPLTADAGAGNPVGTVIVVCSNQIPSNYLPLGTQYDTSLYPVLYALLGTNTTPTASALGLPTLTSGQYAIKATSGLSENAQDNVINTLNEQRSYSTEEHLTGRKWIDGKDVYECTLVCTTTGNFVGGGWTDLTSMFSGLSQLSIDTIIEAGYSQYPNYKIYEIQRYIVNEPTVNSGHFSALYPAGGTLSAVQGYSILTVEYTKTN